MEQLTQTGDYGNGTAAAALSANTLVKRGSVAGEIDVCGAGNTPVGAVTADWASGAKGVTYVRKGKGQVVVLGTTAINPGEFCKPGAAGEVAPEGTVTVRTADTCGVAITACAGAHKPFLMEWA